MWGDAVHDENSPKDVPLDELAEFEQVPGGHQESLPR